VEIFEFEQFSALLPKNSHHFSMVQATTLIIFPHCGPQCKKIIGVESNNAEKHALTEIEHISLLLPTMRKNDWRCGQEEEELPPHRKVKHFFVSLSLVLMGQIT
jgi:hypothetical protein